MPIYKIEGPDGRIHEIEGPAGASDAQLIAVLKQHMASQPKPPEETLIGSALRGGKSMLGSEQTGIASLFDANKAALEGLERQKKIAEEHPSEDSWERVKKAYQEKGLGSAVAEYARQVPYAIAEQTPQIAQSMAGAAAGAATPVPGGSLIGAFVPSFTQQYGGFLESQAREQQARGEPVDVSRFKAAAAAVPAAAIDVAQTLIPMGKGLIKSIFGPNVEKLLSRGATEEAEKLARNKLAQEGFLKTLGKGTVKGAALETPGEVIQQMLDRAQAGQSLLDDDALADYGRTAFQTTQLGPLGAVGRFQDKSAARTQVDVENRAEAAKKAQEAQAEQQRLAAEEAAKQAAYRQTPEYLTEIQQRYDALQNSAKDIRARMNAKVQAGDLAAETDRNNARAEYRALKADEETKKTVSEYLAAKKRIDEQNAGVADAKAREEAGKVPGAQMDLFGGMPEVTDKSPVGQLRTLDSQIKGLDAQIADAKKTGDQTQVQALTNQQFDLQKEMQRLAPAPQTYAAMEGTINRQIDDLRTKMGATTETAELERYVNLIKEQKDSLKKLEELKPFVSEKPKTTDVTSREAELQGLKKKIASFQELGDDEAIGRLLPRVKELEAEPTLMEGEQFRNTPTDDLFAAEMNKGAQEARATREKVEAEIEKLRGIAEKSKAATPVQQALRDKELEEARGLLSLFDNGEQDWNKLKADPANT